MSRRSPAIKAVPTTYNGVRFRSRLEARWASWLDSLRWSWEYEPDIQSGFVIPDFLLTRTAIPVLVECKPATSFVEIAEYRTAMIRRVEGWLEDGVQREVALLDSSSAELALTDRALDDLDRIRIGLNPLGRSRRLIVVGPTLFDQGDRVTLDGEYGFSICFRDPELHPGAESHVGLAGTIGEPCLICGQPVTAWMTSSLILQEWREAGNSVQWRPADA